MKNLETKQLENILGSTHAADIKKYLKDNSGSFAPEENAFGEYMKDIIRDRKMKECEVFEWAGISSKYGYKILNGEKHPQNRDLILCLCIAGQFTADEAKRALKLYGMAPLYAKVKRDAVLTIALNDKLRNIGEVDELLKEHGLPVLERSKSEGE